MPTMPSSNGNTSEPVMPPASMMPHMASAASPLKASNAGFGACLSICSRLSDDDGLPPDVAVSAAFPVAGDGIPPLCALPALPRDSGASLTDWLPAIAYARCTGSPTGTVIHRKI